MIGYSSNSWSCCSNWWSRSKHEWPSFYWGSQSLWNSKHRFVRSFPTGLFLSWFTVTAIDACIYWPIKQCSRGVPMVEVVLVVDRLIFLEITNRLLYLKFCCLIFPLLLYWFLQQKYNIGQCTQGHGFLLANAYICLMNQHISESWPWYLVACSCIVVSPVLC